MKDNKNVLVTGGAGFIGYHLTLKLLERGYSVRVFDNLYRANSEAVEELKSLAGVEFIEGDIRYFDQINKAMDGIDLVSHQAAVCINKSVSAPAESTEINLHGSINVFESAKLNNIPKIVYASSASVYGDPIKLPMSEDDKLLPITPYCIAKMAIEQLANFYALNHKMNFIGLRYFNVYGPRQPVDAFYTNVVVLFIKRILNGEPPLIKGTGEQSMDFIHVDDIVSANILSLESEIQNEVFNVGTNTSTTIKELAEILLSSMNKGELKPIFSGDEAMVSRRQADITKIQNLMNWEPKISATQGLNEVAIDIMNNPHKY
jgi:UDP-glucose 4-epimerase